MAGNGPSIRELEKRLLVLTRQHELMVESGKNPAYAASLLTQARRTKKELTSARASHPLGDDQPEKEYTVTMSSGAKKKVRARTASEAIAKSGGTSAQIDYSKKELTFARATAARKAKNDFKAQKDAKMDPNKARSKDAAKAREDLLESVKRRNDIIKDLTTQVKSDQNRVSDMKDAGLSHLDSPELMAAQRQLRSAQATLRSFERTGNLPGMGRDETKRALGVAGKPVAPPNKSAGDSIPQLELDRLVRDVEEQNQRAGESESHLRYKGYGDKADAARLVYEAHNDPNSLVDLEGKSTVDLLKAVEYAQIDKEEARRAEREALRIKEAQKTADFNDEFGAPTELPGPAPGSQSLPQSMLKAEAESRGRPFRPLDSISPAETARQDSAAGDTAKEIKSLLEFAAKGDKQAFTALMARSRSSNDDERRNAIAALAQLGQNTAPEDPEVRESGMSKLLSSLNAKGLSDPNSMASKAARHAVTNPRILQRGKFARKYTKQPKGTLSSPKKGLPTHGPKRKGARNSSKNGNWFRQPRDPKTGRWIDS